MPDTTVQNRYALVITCDGQLITNTTFDTLFDRRDKCVAILKVTDRARSVDTQDVQDILDRLGGADPDGAIGSISELYSEFGYDIYLEIQKTPHAFGHPLGLPPLLHSVFIDYHEENNSANSIVHFTDTAKRAEYLRQRLNNLSAAAALSLSEHDLTQKLQKTLRSLINDQVTVSLISTDWIV